MTCDYANTHFAVFNLKSVDYLVKFIRHVEKQETEMKQKLEMETENGNCMETENRNGNTTFSLL